jgi:hypothetical protein
VSARRKNYSLSLSRGKKKEKEKEMRDREGGHTKRALGRAAKPPSLVNRWHVNGRGRMGRMLLLFLFLSFLLVGVKLRLPI